MMVSPTSVGCCSLILLAMCAVQSFSGRDANANDSSPTGKTESSPPAQSNKGQQPKMLRVYVGTYTQGDSQGIYSFQLNLAKGVMSPPVLAAETVNPSFVALHPTGRFLYAVNEIGDFQGKSSGAVSAFAVDNSTGKLTLINQQPSGGDGPCHLVVDKAGKNVLLANYGGGSVSVLPIQAGGGLGTATAFVQHQGSSVDPRRQQGPHGHSINLDRANKFAFAADLGLDQILVYRFDSSMGTLTANKPPFAKVQAGSGPRHFSFHPSEKYAYVINEMSSTITPFQYDASQGTLTALQSVSTLPANFDGNSSTAEVQVHPTGRFVYGSNRGHDSIAMFSVDANNGTLTPIGHESTGGKTPRNFGIDPTGQFLLAANQSTNSIVLFRIDNQSGKLTATGQQIEVGAPVCVKMLAF